MSLFIQRGSFHRFSLVFRRKKVPGGTFLIYSLIDDFIKGIPTYLVVI